MSAGAREDEAVAGSYDWVLLKRLLAYLVPHRGAVGLAFGLIAIMSSLDLAGPYLTKLAIDRHIATGDAIGLTRVALLFVGTLVLAFLVRFGQIYVLQITGQAVMIALRREIFTHLQRLHVGFFDRNPVGRLMTRVTSDVDAINELFTSGVVTVAGDILTLAGIMAVLLAMNPFLALVTFSVIPLLFAVTHWFRKGARLSFREVRGCVARMNAFLQENLSGISVVQVFRREERNAAAFARINRDHAEANLRSIFYYAVFYPAIELLAAVAVALILVQGGGRVLAGALSMGALVAFIQYSERFWRPISDLSEKFNVLQAAMASAERIFGLLDTRVEVAAKAAPVRLTRVEGHVAFESVSFAYRDEHDVLRDVSFSVAPGRSVALVGATGSGKTTIISLLARFYDVRTGRISLDGVDIRELDPAELRASMALVLQDIQLSSGTVASNIRLGSAIPDSRVRWAAEAVAANRFIEALPNGYETEVKERGATLSLGQRQLISFARALAHDPRILILDEATSSVDTETELSIRRALGVLLRGRTAIIIAHRLSTVQSVDEILVVHKGRIRERGSHQQLLAQRGLYWRLYLLQYQDQERRARVEEGVAVTAP